MELGDEALLTTPYLAISAYLYHPHGEFSTDVGCLFDSHAEPAYQNL